MSARRFLLVPELGRSRGLGHIVRSFALASELDGEVSIVLPERPDTDQRTRTELLDTLPVDPIACEIVETIAARYDFVVFDQMRPSLSDLRKCEDALTVGIDAGGEARRFLSYLIDTLPNLERTPANTASTGFLRPVTTKRSGFPDGLSSVLVSFGGADPAGLTVPTVKSIVESSIGRPASVTAVWGPFAPRESLPVGVQVLDAPKDLRERLHMFDLVVTSFGLTAYEALSANVPVALVNPTAYHDALSRKAGFLTFGVGRRAARRVAGAKKKFGEIVTASRSLAPPKPVALSDTLNALAPEGVRGISTYPVIARFRDRTYRRAPSGLIAMQRYSPSGIQYSESYFSDEYKKQYGRTYLEDFDSIAAVAHERINTSERVAPAGSSTTLLDIGCAYGPFLASAHERGYRVFGIDVAHEPVEYVTNTLGLRALSCDVRAFDPAVFGISTFDRITMWYVIEHFAEIDDILRTVARLIAPGGVFAFSTPNATGVSGRRDPRRFLESSPADHFTVWSPRSAARVLREYGFAVKKIRVTGHHPERFTVSSTRLGARKPIQDLLGIFSRVFGRGDTFEVYAVRTKGNP